MVPEARYLLVGRQWPLQPIGVQQDLWVAQEAWLPLLLLLLLELQVAEVSAKGQEQRVTLLRSLAEAATGRGMLADSWPDGAGRLLRPSLVAEGLTTGRSAVREAVAEEPEVSRERVRPRRDLLTRQRMMAEEDVPAVRMPEELGHSDHMAHFEAQQNGQGAEVICRASPPPPLLRH